MHFLKYLLAISPLLFSHVAALPWIPFTKRAETNTLAPPTIGLFLCVDAYWAGECEYLNQATAVCFNLPTPLAGNVSAVGPDKPASGCTLYEEAGCKGEYLADIAYPGLPNLAEPDGPEGGRYNDFFNSYICY